MFSAERSPADEPLSDCPSYEYLAEVQAFESSIDTMNNSEISEAITDIKWIKNGQKNRPQLLVSNARSVIRFRLKEQITHKRRSAYQYYCQKKILTFPKSKETSREWFPIREEDYMLAHKDRVRSLCITNDYENFIVADGEQINLYNIERGQPV